MDWDSPRTALAVILLAHIPTLAVSIFHYYSPFARRVVVIGLVGAACSTGATLWLASPLTQVASWNPSTWLQPLMLGSNWVFWTFLNLFLMGYLLTFFRNRQPVSYPVKRVCFLTGLIFSLLLISGSLNLFSLFLGSILLSICYSFFLGNVGDFEDYQAIGVVTWRNGCADILGLFALTEGLEWGLPVYFFVKSLALSPLQVWRNPTPSIWVLFLLMCASFFFPAYRLGLPLWVFVGGIVAGGVMGLMRVNELAAVTAIGKKIGEGLGIFEKWLQWVLALPLRLLKAGWVVVTFADDASLKGSLLFSLAVTTVLILLFG